MNADQPPGPGPTLPAVANEGEIFPKLSEEQIARIVPFAHEHHFADGETLWNQGDSRNSLFVVLEGAVEIRSGKDQIVTAHQPGGFTGDVDLLSGRPAVMKGQARGATRTLELPSPRLRGLVQTDPELSEIFLKAFIARRSALVDQHAGSLTLMGSRHSAGTLELQEFLTRNSRPYTYMDVDQDAGVQAMFDTFGVGVDDVPVLICREEGVLKKPTIERVGECLGLNRVNEEVVRDLVVIGAGPAGLAAAVYAASEGLDVLVLEASAPGGQAGSSSHIENYLGFPTGISGQKLASNAFVQAEKFGAEFAVARTAIRLGCERRPYQIDLGGGVCVQARTVIIATGVQYRKPDIPDLNRFEGLGVYYGATPVEAKFCEGDEVIVVGGGNSAGQAAVFLSGHGRQVHMLVRGPCLAESMSRYLIRRIEETKNIELRTSTRLEALEGAQNLERVRWRCGDAPPTTCDIRHVFLMTGANPNTTWLQNCVAMDDKGFVKTGPDLQPDELQRAGWPPGRAPLLFETTLPGVFAVGDVRATSVKRVAAAVGEGSVCVQLVHKVLAG